MSIAIATIWNESFRGIAEITNPVMQEYCMRHGYTFLSVCSLWKSPEIIWERLAVVNNLKENSETVVYMDCDVLITNLTKRIQELNDPAFDHVATSENFIINDGVFIWNTKKWIEVLRMEEFSENYSSPQDAINKVYGSAMDIKHLTPRSMNSVLNEEYGTKNELTEWQHGDFVLHLPGIGNERRIQILKEYSQKIIR